MFVLGWEAGRENVGEKEENLRMLGALSAFLISGSVLPTVSIQKPAPGIEISCNRISSMKKIFNPVKNG